MRKTRKFLALLLALCLILSLGFTAVADEEAEAGEDLDDLMVTTVAAEDYTRKTVILHSNDVHGAVEGYAYIAALKADFEAKGAEVVLVDAGDFSQGTTYVSVSKGATAVELMNAAGYNFVTLGNHEFDFGSDQLKANMEKGEFKVVCADVYENGELLFDASAVYETKSGVKLGFFGMETPETQTKVNPGLIKTITFATGDDFYKSASDAVEGLKGEGADLVIGIVHLGVDAESLSNGYGSTNLYEKVEGIDIMIDGHSHTVMTEGENGEPIQSTGTKFANIGVIVIDDETKAIESNYLVSTEGLEKDETVDGITQEIITAVDEQYGAVFATTEVRLNGDKAPGNRTEETNLGDLITDAMVWSVLRAEGSVKVDADHVVGITNGGGIRATIEAGDITMKDINTVLPFGNTVAVIYVTGAELLEALEASTFCTPSAIGGYPQTAGIQFTLKTYKAYAANEETYPGSTYYGPSAIKRVAIKTINGKSFSKTATYAVVTNNFCAAGGDTYYAFKAAYDRGDGFDTGIPMDQAVMEYITEVLEGTITEEKYGATRGDQVVIDADHPEVRLTTQNLSIDGELQDKLEIYNINGENYFKIRDLAALLTGTGAQFNVDYDAATRTIKVTTGEAYEPLSTDLAKEYTNKAASCVKSNKTIEVNGEAIEITSYAFGGHNFFRLRSLGEALGFGVDWDASTRTMLVTTTAPAAEEEAA